MKISRHAQERASERLDWPTVVLDFWVNTTQTGWAPMSAEYFKAHGCQISGKDKNETLYRCPLDEHRALCLVVADHTLVTLMPFDLLPGEGLTLFGHVKLVAKPSAPAAAKATRRTMADVRKRVGVLKAKADKVRGQFGELANLTGSLISLLELIEKDDK